MSEITNVCKFYAAYNDVENSFARVSIFRFILYNVPSARI